MRCPFCGGPEVVANKSAGMVGTYCRDCEQTWESAPRTGWLKEQEEGRLLCGKGAARAWKGRLLRERSEEAWLRALAKI